MNSAVRRGTTESWWISTGASTVTVRRYTNVGAKPAVELVVERDGMHAVNSATLTRAEAYNVIQALREAMEGVE